MKAIFTWLHRLHCVAWAFRGANSVMTLVDGETMLIGHCRACGNMRVVQGCSSYVAGQTFWSPDPPAPGSWPIL